MKSNLRTMPLRVHTVAGTAHIRRNIKSRGTRFSSDRAGTTLSEVLISLLVMSVGVVSLATLFPISVLRSVQATQLTNATILRYNVEALVGALPQIYTVGSPWQPSTNYAQNAMVTPTQYSSLKYPPLVAVCTSAGESDIIEPNWLAANPLTETPGGWTGPTWQIFLLQNYIVDPQGEYAASYDDPNALGRGPSAGPHFFGNTVGYPSAIGFSPSIRAFSGVNFQSTTFGTPSSYDDYLAANVSILPDSWVLQAESKSVTYTAGNTTCTLNDLTTDLTLTTPVPTANGTSTIVPAAFSPARIVFYDITGKKSHVRTIMGISGSIPTQTIDWTPAVGTPSLPSNFTPATARVETLERRYSWLLSVRRGFSGSASMDVVVFFRRKYTTKDEQIYPATFQTGPIDPNNSDAASGTWAFYAADPGYDGAPGIWTVDDDQNGTTDDASELGYPGSDDAPRNWVVIQYDSTGDKPFYKKGGFVADANNLRWYRITDVIEGSSPSAVMVTAGVPISATNLPTYVPDAAITGFTSVLLRLERPIDQSGSVPSGGAGNVPTGGAIMMRGIVEVYPIRTQLSLDD